MSFDAEIKIFGKVADPEAFWDLANEVAVVDRRFHFKSGEAATSEFMRDLYEACEKGEAVEVYGSDMKDVFEDLKVACLKADLSFVVKYSDGGDEYTHGLAWQPGMMDEFEFLWDGDKAAISSDLVRKASEKGAETVTALLDRVAAVTSAGKIEIEAGFADAFKAFRDGDGEDLDDDEEEATSVHP